MRFLLYCLMMLLISGTALAQDDESIELTTYYPAPYGDYEELSTTGNTYLATDSGRVGIGTTGPSTILDVSGVLTLRGMPADTDSGQIYFDSNADSIRIRENNGPWHALGFTIPSSAGQVLDDVNGGAPNPTEYNIGSNFNFVIFQGAIKPSDSYPAGGFLWRSGNSLYAMTQIHGRGNDTFTVTTTYQGTQISHDRAFLIKKNEDGTINVKVEELYLQCLKIK